RDARLLAELVELFEADVADPDQAGAAGVVDRLHRPPGLPVVRGEAVPPARAVEEVGVDDRGPQVLQRAGERLLDLPGDRGPGVVGQAVVLPRSEGELRLEEQVVAGRQAARDRVGDGLPDRGLVVMAALVGGVDAAEALAEGQLGQAPRLLLLPGGPVQEAGY